MANREALTVGSDTRPPMLFEGEFNEWKGRFDTYIDGKSETAKDLWDSFLNGPKVFPHPETGVPLKPYELSVDAEVKRAQADIDARNIIMQALPQDMYRTISSLKTAKELLDEITKQQEGYSQSDQTKLDLALALYEDFGQLPNELLKDYYRRYCGVINDLRKAGLNKDNQELNMKFLKKLNADWAPYGNNFRASKNVSKFNIHELVGRLMNHQSDVVNLQSARNNPVVSLKDPAALFVGNSSRSHQNHSRSSKSKQVVSSDSDSFSDVEEEHREAYKTAALFTKQLNLRRSSGFSKTNNNLRTSTTSAYYKRPEVSKPQPRVPETKDSDLACFNCGKPGHFARECRAPKRKDAEYYKKKLLLVQEMDGGRVLKASEDAWLNWSDSDQEEERANMVKLTAISKPPAPESSESEDEVLYLTNEIMNIVLHDSSNMPYDRSTMTSTSCDPYECSTSSDPLLSSMHMHPRSSEFMPVANVAMQIDRKLPVVLDKHVDDFTDMRKNLRALSSQVSGLQTENARIKNELKVKVSYHAYKKLEAQLAKKVAELTELEDSVKPLRIEKTNFRLRSEVLTEKLSKSEKELKKITVSQKNFQKLEEQKTIVVSNDLAKKTSECVHLTQEIEKLRTDLIWHEDYLFKTNQSIAATKFTLSEQAKFLMRPKNPYNKNWGIGYDNPMTYEKIAKKYPSMFDGRYLKIGLPFDVVFSSEDENNEALQKRSAKMKREIDFIYKRLNDLYKRKGNSFEDETVFDVVNENESSEPTKRIVYLPTLVLEEYIHKLEDELDATKMNAFQNDLKYQIMIKAMSHQLSLKDSEISRLVSNVHKLENHITGQVSKMCDFLSKGKDPQEQPSCSMNVPVTYEDKETILLKPKTERFIPTVPVYTQRVLPPHHQGVPSEPTPVSERKPVIPAVTILKNPNAPSQKAKVVINATAPPRPPSSARLVRKPTNLLKQIYEGKGLLPTPTIKILSHPAPSSHDRRGNSRNASMTKFIHHHDSSTSTSGGPNASSPRPIRIQQQVSDKSLGVVSETLTPTQLRNRRKRALKAKRTFERELKTESNDKLFNSTGLDSKSGNLNTKTSKSNDNQDFSRISSSKNELLCNHENNLSCNDLVKLVSSSVITLKNSDCVANEMLAADIPPFVCTNKEPNESWVPKTLA